MPHNNTQIQIGIIILAKVIPIKYPADKVIQILAKVTTIIQILEASVINVNYSYFGFIAIKFKIKKGSKINFANFF